MMKKYYFIFVVIFSFSLPASSEVYKWIDEDGNVHFSDKPNSSDSETYNVSGSSGGKPSEQPGHNQAGENGRFPSDPRKALNVCRTRICNLVRKLDPNCTTNDCYRSLKYSESCTGIICRQKKMDLIADFESRLNPKPSTNNSPRMRDPRQRGELSEKDKARIIAKCEKDRDYYCDKGAEYILEYERNKGPAPESPLDRLNRHHEQNGTKERYRGNDVHIR